MWRLRLSKTWDWLKSRRLVGEDKYHLFYTEFVAKGKSDRRYVEYKDNNITDSSDRMPIEWWSWLHNRRDNVPTDEELRVSERARQALAERVAVLEAEDERQRLRGFTPPTNDDVNMGDVAKLVMKNDNEEAGARRRRKALERLKHASSGQSDLTSGKHSHVVTHGSDVERNVHEEPTGAGEDFQPGSWNPSSTAPRRRQ